ncbi:hypothetical protein [Thermogymnomonas acidicola]|uniref:3-phosphoshikimate 1-carboxyvinyltransferase n=1 Tax=Thermogymnomonas acidicola TaxID=399579 RepID=UPI0009463EFC|nr:hypothetical protein [Thermogymnomonas acidicola]
MILSFSSPRLSGSLVAPSSKSYSQRAILLSSAIGGETLVTPVSGCDDEIVSEGVARAAGGSSIREEGSGGVRITPPDFRCPGSVYVGESGTTYRLAMGLLAAMGCTVDFNGGEPSLSRRPIGWLLEALSRCGVSFSPPKGDGFLRMDASRVLPSPVDAAAMESSQFVSSMMLFYALSGQRGGTVIRFLERPPSMEYVEVTAEVLRSFGMRVGVTGKGVEMHGDVRSPGTFHVEGDYSSVSFIVSATSLLDGSEVRVSGLNRQSVQPDSALVRWLERNGLAVWDRDVLVVSGGSTGGIEVDADRTPDLAPVAAAIGISTVEGGQGS